ncbi:MAG TPA: S8 family serine peptidase, partial [Candidatus Saccharimonadales bacterium]|nr:S8 family serine peptidase [Candidatus Saccharimonadales bacterium]
VVAPGLYIASARSDMIPVSNSDPDAYHRVLAGTSMATPHVAGAIALMLQYSPTLLPSQIAQLIEGNARLDAFTGLALSGSPIWGFGKLDARTATGFYRLTVIAGNLPPSESITIRIDNSTGPNIGGGSWYDLYFKKSTKHTIDFEADVSPDSNIRYSILNEPFLISTSQFLTVTYKTQYLVETESPLSANVKVDWYDANSTLKTSTPPLIRSAGLLANLGGEYSWFGLISNEGQMISGNLTINRPETLTEIYLLSYSWITSALTLFLSIILLIVVLKRRSSSERLQELG